MLAIARFSVPLAQSQEFADQLEVAKAALSHSEGCIDAELGQNLDDPILWVLMTQWKNVGSYRRALNSLEVKALAVPILAQALDEPGAYESERNA